MYLLASNRDKPFSYRRFTQCSRKHEYSTRTEKGKRYYALINAVHIKQCGKEKSQKRSNGKAKEYLPSAKTQYVNIM
jgi:hypothetical protein